MLTKLFRAHALTDAQAVQLSSVASDRLGLSLGPIATEWCYYIEHIEPFDGQELLKLNWLLSETFEPDGFSDTSRISAKTVLEVGPRLNFVTPYSSTAVDICRDCGLEKITRLERACRYGLDVELSDAQANLFLEPLHDRMIQMRYREPLMSFGEAREPEPVRVINVMGDDWREKLLAFGKSRNCYWDEQDLNFMGDLFRNELKRNPTDVELFQLGQANSEHSRHGFFKGIHTIDNVQEEMTLMDIVKLAWHTNPNNSLLAFCDDSSAIRGHKVPVFEPVDQTKPGPFVTKIRFRHLTLTAETHNHPTLICPQPLVSG